MDVEEQNIEDLFENDNAAESEDEPNIESNIIEGANLVLGERTGDGDNEDVGTSTKEIKPKRKIAKQPLLNVDRILGNRGIKVLENLFEDFEPTPGKEFEDLDTVMSRMKHWAHRLYPKLPFEDVTNQIAKLGSKMVVQTNIKRIRLDLGVDQYFDKKAVNSDDENPAEENKSAPDEDATERYGDGPQDDIFEQMIREADQRREQEVGQAGDNPTTTVEENEAPHPISTPTLLTEEQKERMLRNRQIAEEKKKKKEAAKLVSLQLEEVLQKMFI